jgi:mono/diheme cytochrome c family protein
MKKDTARRVLGAVTVLAALTPWLAGCRREAPPTGQGASGPLSWSIEPAGKVAPSPEVLERGRALFGKQCAACHGADGAGNGLAAYLLYPRPRDFVKARYRLVSTWEGVPTDEDIYRSISRGMPGSAMPSWAHLPEADRWALVHHVKSLAENPIEVGSPSPEDPRLGVVPIPPEPPPDAAGAAKAADLFVKACAPCHGEGARGDGVQKQFDSEGYPTRPRDLTLGVFKGDPAPEHVYRRIVAGMPGTPMPSAPALSGDDAWRLVHLIRSLSSPEQRERVEMRRFRILARRVPSIPGHPDDGGWRSAPRVNLHLMPLWWRSERPEELTVQAVHDGKEAALLLTWADETHDQTAMRPQEFRDAAAVQFSPSPDPPFFAMGAAGEFVNIWMWKSERQADLEPAFQDLETVYPYLGIDAYPNLSVSPLEQPTRNALTLQSDPTFVTGWGAGNIVSDPTRRSPVEDLTAQGFGTLAARPRPDQRVVAAGVHSTGTYRVLFRRSLEGSGARAVSFRPGATVPVAFAVWNGSAGDRDGKKSVTIWQELELEE